MNLIRLVVTSHFQFLFINLWMPNTRGEVCPENMFSRGCSSVCHCRNDVACDVTTGECSAGCANGWDGPSCQKANIAYRRETDQKEGKESEPSSLAVDDDVTSCSATKNNVPGWWRIKLDHVTEIKTIQILSSPTINIKDWRIFVGLEESIYSMALCAMVDIHGNGATVNCDYPVIGLYVMVVNRLSEVVLCNLEINVCSQFWFGANCDRRCNCLDSLENCDSDTGACATGCTPGWTGRGCHTKCVQHYGPNCVHPCGHCAAGDQCDVTTGSCPGECLPGWTGDLCTTGCSNHTYGTGCRRRCGWCRGGRSCDPITGMCPDGCEAGFAGDRCDQECPAGLFGENCVSRCGQCAQGHVCDITTGHCPGGCAPGWEGLFCTQVCLAGFYGVNCSTSCAMCHDGNCDVATGSCLDGCAEGYTGDNCAQSCTIGNYGRDCKLACGHCSRNDEDMYCDLRNGSCQFGCEPGYNGTTCNITCKQGFYGEGCKKCGVCKAGTQCDVITGVCPEGCGLNFYGERCLQADAFSDQDGPQLQVFLGSTIGFVGGIMTIVVICLVFTWQREHLPTMAEIKTKSNKTEIVLVSKFAKNKGKGCIIEEV